MTTAAPRQLLVEPELPSGARRVRAAIPCSIEVNDPRARKRAPNNEDYDVRIVASARRVARDQGLIPIDAWARDIAYYLANPVVLWAHSYREFPVATCVQLEIDATAGQLVAYWRFLVGISDDDYDKFCGRLQALYAVRGLRACSVGFIVREFRDPTDAEKMEALNAGDPEPRWVAARAELLEMSCVPVPADPHALTVDHALADAEAKHIDVSVVRARWAALRETPASPVVPAQPAPPAQSPAVAVRDAGDAGDLSDAPTPPAAEPAAPPAAEAAPAAAPAADVAPAAEVTPPAEAAANASSSVLDVSDEEFRSFVRTELATAFDAPAAPAARHELFSVLTEADWRRITQEETQRMLVRDFGFPARRPSSQRTS